VDRPSLKALPTEAQQEGVTMARYVCLVRHSLAVSWPSSCPIVLNRGISGNKIPDLQKRWQRDVLDGKPDILSIYIGINDVWQQFDGKHAAESHVTLCVAPWVEVRDYESFIIRLLGFGPAVRLHEPPELVARLRGWLVPQAEAG